MGEKTNIISSIFFPFTHRNVSAGHRWHTNRTCVFFILCPIDIWKLYSLLLLLLASQIQSFSYIPVNYTLYSNNYKTFYLPKLFRGLSPSASSVRCSDRSVFSQRFMSFSVSCTRQKQSSFVYSDTTNLCLVSSRRLM